MHCCQTIMVRCAPQKTQRSGATTKNHLAANEREFGKCYGDTEKKLLKAAPLFDEHERVGDGMHRKRDSIYPRKIGDANRCTRSARDITVSG